MPNFRDVGVPFIPRRFATTAQQRGGAYGIGRRGHWRQLSGGPHRDPAAQDATAFQLIRPIAIHQQGPDDEAEAYIVDSLAELPHARSAELVIHLPQAEVELRTATDLAEAIHGYFGYRQGVTRHKLRALFRIGRTSLLIGLVFLAVCTLLSEAVSRAEWPSLGNLLEQGLLIIGWVANWRPLEIFLYDGGR